jgi:hypothetical protein
MPETPLDRLKRMTAWDTVPTLSPDELDALLASSALADGDGNAPSDDGWTPTYAFRSAARGGWALKMGKAAELQSTDLDGDRMSANQVFDHCERMVKRYSSTGSPVMRTSITEGETNVAAEAAFD